MSAIEKPAFRHASYNVGRLVDEAVHAIEAADSIEALYGYVGSLCRQVGFDYFSYFVLDPLQLSERPATDPMGSSSYPETWRAHYVRLGYQQHDPLLKAGPGMRRPFVWGGREYVGQLTGKARRMFDEARSFGICGGLSVPVYGPSEDSGVFSASSHETGAAFEAIVRENFPMLHVVAHQMHAAMVERLLQPGGPADVRLSEQERLCLIWTLRGKTAWETAQIIGRSRPTVNFHLQKSMRKLGATSKSRAALKAKRAGLI